MSTRPILFAPSEGIWRLVTETASVYLVDQDNGTVTVTLPGQQPEGPFRLTAAHELVVGSQMYLRFVDPSAATGARWALSSTVVSIEAADHDEV